MYCRPSNLCSSFYKLGIVLIKIILPKCATEREINPILRVNNNNNDIIQTNNNNIHIHDILICEKILGGLESRLFLLWFSLLSFITLSLSSMSWRVMSPLKERSRRRWSSVKSGYFSVTSSRSKDNISASSDRITSVKALTASSGESTVGIC